MFALGKVTGLNKHVHVKGMFLWVCVSCTSETIKYSLIPEIKFFSRPMSVEAYQMSEDTTVVNYTIRKDFTTLEIHPGD